MEFDIGKYTSNAEYRLKQVPKEGRIAYAAWCAQGLVDESLPFLSTYLQFDDLEILLEALTVIWRASTGEQIAADIHERVQSKCAYFFWIDVGFSANEIEENFAAIQALDSVMLALDVCKTGSAHNAAMAAECWINVLDRQISYELNTRNYIEVVFQHPRMTSEIARQQKMLDCLEEKGGLGQNEKRLFRG